MSEIHKFTDSQIIEALRATAEENPDRVYKAPEHLEGEALSCFYVHTDPETGDPVSPGCGVGVALHSLGVSLEELAKCEGQAADTAIERLTPRDPDGEAARFALTFQNYQDDGDTWADSLRAAEEAV